MAFDIYHRSFLQFSDRGLAYITTVADPFTCYEHSCMLLIPFKNWYGVFHDILIAVIKGNENRLFRDRSFSLIPFDKLFHRKRFISAFLDPV